MPVLVNMPARMPPFSAEGMPNLRVSVPLSSDADPPQALHVRADGGNVAGVSTSTLTGFDRIASRRVIITVVVLMVIVTGLSIWAQRSTGRETDTARAHVHALQVAENSAAGFAAATTTTARRRAVNRASAQLAAVDPTPRVRAARKALVAERRALALPGGGVATLRAQKVAGDRLGAALDRLSRSERAATAATLADVSSKQSYSWYLTLIAFPGRLVVLAALFVLLRITGRRARAGTDAKLANLEKAATTDPLTGLRNRRTFDDDLSQALAKGRVCLVMLDLDGLKQTNERLGHAVGDERIRAVSAALRAANATRPGLPPRRRRVRRDPGRGRRRCRASLRPSRPGRDARPARRRRPERRRRRRRRRDPHVDQRPDAARGHRAAGREAHDLADPRALARARHRHARDARRAQAGCTGRRSGCGRRRQGRRRLRPQRYRGRARGQHRRAPGAWSARRSTRCASRPPARRRLPRRRRRHLRQGRAAHR